MVINKTLEWSDKQSIAFLITEEEDKRASEPSTQEVIGPLPIFLESTGPFLKARVKKYICV